MKIAAANANRSDRDQQIVFINLRNRKLAQFRRVGFFGKVNKPSHKVEVRSCRSSGVKDLWPQTNTGVESAIDQWLKILRGSVPSVRASLRSAARCVVARRLGPVTQ